MRFRPLLPLLALLGAPGAALSQQTVVRTDGSQLHGQVQRVAPDRIELLVTSGLRKGPSSVPCSEVLCVVDGALTVHTRPCGRRSLRSPRAARRAMPWCARTSRC